SSPSSSRSSSSRPAPRALSSSSSTATSRPPRGGRASRSASAPGSRKICTRTSRSSASIATEDEEPLRPAAGLREVELFVVLHRAAEDGELGLVRVVVDQSARVAREAGGRVRLRGGGERRVAPGLHVHARGLAARDARVAQAAERGGHGLPDVLAVRER